MYGLRYGTLPIVRRVGGLADTVRDDAGLGGDVALPANGFVFDAATPARKKGLPLTLANNWVVLQEIFLKYGLPSNRIHTNCRVMSYDTSPIDGGGVTVGGVTAVQPSQTVTKAPSRSVTRRRQTPTSLARSASACAVAPFGCRCYAARIQRE